VLIRILFMADMQLGAYASFSGLSDDDVARYRDRGMRVEAVERVTGHEWDAGRYRAAVRMAGALRPDLVLIGGDMVDDPNSEDQYDEFMEITGSLDRSIAVRWVPGNHDIAPDTVVPTPESIARYRDAFGPDSHAFDLGPVRVVAWNTVVASHPELVPGEWEAQLGFLAEELAAARRRDRPVILAGHHPLFTVDPGEDDDYWNVPGLRRRQVLELVHRHRVPLGLAGHWHRNSIARDGDFEMVTSGPVGYPLGDDPSGVRMIEVEDRAVVHRYLELEP
jgi:3',5'-cyclic AMP phosphodiesterase CpdA